MGGRQGRTRSGPGPAEAGRHVRWMWVFTGPCLALAIALTTVGCRRDPPPVADRQPTVVPVGAVAAQKSAIRAVIHVTGTVVPAQGGEFLVLAPEPARLAEVTKAQGDAVQSGDVLARFELPYASQTVARYTAELAAAQAQVENARANQERVRGFVERGLVARRDLDTAEREAAEAQGALERARASHAAAQAGADRAIVRAPFDGVVATRARNAGDMILSTTDPVLRVVDPRRLEVVASVPRKEQSRVITGATARIATAGGDPVQLTVAGPATEIQMPEESVAFRLTFAGPSDVAVDTPVQLDIDAEERTDTVLIPAEALVREGAEMAVFVADGSIARRRIVKTGIEDLARVEITSGLNAGELVITRGHVGLADGAAITVASGR